MTKSIESWMHDLPPSVRPRVRPREGTRASLGDAMASLYHEYIMHTPEDILDTIRKVYFRARVLTNTTPSTIPPYQ